MTKYNVNGWDYSEHPDQSEFDDWLLQNEDVVHQVQQSDAFKQHVQRAIDNYIHEDLDVDWDAPDDESQVEQGEWQAPGTGDPPQSFFDEGSQPPQQYGGGFEVDRYGRYKPMKGQGSFNWDDEQHPRETEEHDGKRPGEFAPKEQAEAAEETDSKPKIGGKGKDGWQFVATEFGDELKIKRGADFATDGSYDIEYDGRRGQISRDPENGNWYVNGSGHFADRFIATSKTEAISYIANEGKRWTDHSKPFESEPAIKPEVDSERQKLLDEAREARKWTKNGDGTYTAPNGVVWRRAQQDGEISPVTGKPFRKNEFMPIHGLAAPKPKAEPKPKRESLAGANTKEWKEPKVRQFSESEIAERREREDEQRRWDALRSTPVAEVYWLGDAPTFANWKATRNSNMLTYLAKLQPEQVKALGQQLRAKLIEREVNQYFKPGENERTLRGQQVTRAELAKHVAEDFDHYSESDADVILTKKLRKQFPGIEAAVWGLKSWFDKRLPVEHAEELAAILPKPGAVDRLSAEGWADIERFGKLKPMAGQSSFDWDESEHPRETEAHDDKKPGEFAPKKSASSGIKVPARLASPTRQGEITEEQAKTMKVRGTTEDVTDCDYCGKHSLRKTVVFELTDADGNGTGELRHLGVDCAARLTGRKPERIAKEAASRDYEAKEKQRQHDRDKPLRIKDNLNDANKAFNQTGRHRGKTEIADVSEFRWNDAGQVVRIDTTDPDDVAWYEKKGFTYKQEPRHLPVHPDILDEWRSSDRWAYDNADEWAHANDADPADFDKWVKLRDKVQSASETVSPDLQFHLWDWLSEQADGDIPAGWKQAEKQLGVQLGIYRPWSDDDAKEVEFTARGQRAVKPLFKLEGKSFALNDKRLQELQTQRYGQMFFDFDKPSKQPTPPAVKPVETPEPEPPAGSLAAKLKKYLDLQQDAAKRGLQQPRTNLLK